MIIQREWYAPDMFCGQKEEKLIEYVATRSKEMT
jgi:hypothetical protein